MRTVIWQGVELGPGPSTIDAAVCGAGVNGAGMERPRPHCGRGLIGGTCPALAGGASGVSVLNEPFGSSDLETLNPCLRVNIDDDLIVAVLVILGEH